MRRASRLSIVIRLALAGLLIFGLIRWLTASEPVMHAASISTAELLSFTEAGVPSYAKLMLEKTGASDGAQQAGSAIEILPASYAASAPETLLQAGDEVQFISISKTTFENLYEH